MSVETEQTRAPERRACPKCGYDLTGLAVSAKCPECGFGQSATPGVRRGSGDNLTDAPAWYLRLMALATSLAAVGLVATVATGAALNSALTVGNVLLYGAAVVVWTVGIVLCAWKRPTSIATVRDITLDAPWARRVVVGAQLLHVVSVVLAMAAAMSGATPGSLLYGAFEFLELLAYLGMVPVAIYLSSIAGWAGDDGLEGRLRFVAWGIAVPAVAVPVLDFLVSVSPVFGVLWLAGLVLVFVALLAFLVLLVGMVQLATMSFWAISNASAAAARDQRIAERREREAREAAERIDRSMASLPAEPEPVVRFAEQRVPRPDEPSKPPPRQGYTIKRNRDDDDIYELAD